MQPLNEPNRDPAEAYDDAQGAGNTQLLTAPPNPIAAAQPQRYMADVTPPPPAPRPVMVSEIPAYAPASDVVASEEPTDVPAPPADVPEQTTFGNQGSTRIDMAPNGSFNSGSGMPGATGNGDGSTGVVGGGFAYPEPPRRSRLKKFLLPVLGVVVLLLLVGGYVFGYYIPNKPENVYKSGLTRTGQALDMLTREGTQKTKLDAMSKMDVSGGLTVSGPDGKQTGSFSSHYDDSKSDSTFTYKPESGNAKIFNIQALTDLANGQTYPDAYFKVSGLSVFGLDQFAPELTQFDGKWIHISPAFLQSVVPPQYASQQTKQQSQLTPEDAADLMRAAIATTREYVLTDDPTKNVLENRSFKGKETIDGNIKADHYIVGLNKEHAKDYCKALITNVTNTNGFKRLPGVSTDTLSQDKDSAIRSCQNGADSIKESDTFDMWVNTSNKLVAKIRITDENDASAYFDFGQSYTSGHVFPAYMAYHSGKDHADAMLDLTTNFDTNSTSLSFNGTFGSGHDTWVIKGTAALKPYQGDIKITKPADAVPVENVLKTLGIDPSMLASGLSDTTAASSDSNSVNAGMQDKAKDTERQTDLKALQGQLEAYYAQEGMYPKLSDLNDAAWRSKNLKGLDVSALEDPDGIIPALVVTATPGKQYGYNTGTCDVFNGCQSYILTAVLSDGKTYTLNSLN